MNDKENNDMATPELPSTDATTDATDDASREALLELDLDELPAWATRAIAAIAAIVVGVAPDDAFATLQGLIAPLRSYPEGAGKAACRAAMQLKLAEINATRATLAARPPAAIRQPLATVPEQQPWAGRWCPLKSRPDGTFRSLGRRERTDEGITWGARIEHEPGWRPDVGQMVAVSNARGTRSALQVITQLVDQGETVTIAAVAKPGDTRATQPATQPQPARPATPPRGIPAGAVPIMSLVPPREPATVDTALADIATEGERIAAPAARTTVEPTTRGDGSTGAHDTGGTVHTPTGPSVFDRPPAERVFRVGETRTANQVRALLGEREFIAGAVAAEGAMLQTSWDGGIRSQTTVAAITDALMAIGREADAPGVPSAEAYAGASVGAVASRRGVISRRLVGGKLESGVSAQWQIGHAGIGGSVQAGDAFGRVALVVSLHDDDTLSFDGDVVLANEVRSHYAAATAREVLKSDVLTAWLQRVLRRRHAAVKRGRVWYVPSGQAAAVRALIDAISPLWGDHETIEVTTAKALARSLSRGLSDELAKVRKDLDDETAKAKQRAHAKATKKASDVHNATPEYIAAEADKAADRATISSTVAARILRELGTVAARVGGYEVAIGAEAVAPCKAEIAALRSTLERLTDDTSARAAMLELD